MKFIAKERFSYMWREYKDDLIKVMIPYEGIQLNEFSKTH